MIKRIRPCRFYIDKNKCEHYLKISASMHPVNQPICKDMNAYELLCLGQDEINKDNFVLVKGVIDV